MIEKSLAKWHVNFRPIKMNNSMTWYRSGMLGGLEKHKGASVTKKDKVRTGHEKRQSGESWGIFSIHLPRLPRGLCKPVSMVP